MSPKKALGPGIFVMPSAVFKVDNSHVGGHASLFRLLPHFLSALYWLSFRVLLAV